MRRIGIILINYNGLQDTVECINSIYESDYRNFIIIVIDNASDEDSSVLRNYANVIYKKLDQNVGFGVANNIGAELAIKIGCDLLLCLNNDTVIESNTLSVLARDTTDRVITTGAIYYYASKQELWYGGGEVSRFKGNFRHKNYTCTKNVSFISGCCFMMTVNCYKDIGLFEPEYFMYYEDSDFSIKAITNGYELKYIYKAKIYHKVGKSISRITGLKEYYLTRNRLYIIKKYKNFFFSTSLIYFYVTRGIYMVKQLVTQREVWPIREGILDCHNDMMGARKK